MLKTLKALSAAVVFAASAHAVAQDPGSQARFEALDRNSDGYVSRDEGKDAEELNTRFSELDTNNDGKLSRDEYAELEREAREASIRNAKAGPANSRRSSAAGGSQ